MRPRENLPVYKSFNTLCKIPSPCPQLNSLFCDTQYKNNPTGQLRVCGAKDVLGQVSVQTQSRQSAKLFLLSSELGLPHPSPAGECAPLWFGVEGHTRWREKGWESPNSDEGTYTVVLFIYIYVLCRASLHLRPNSWTKSKQKSSEFSSLKFTATSTVLP